MFTLQLKPGRDKSLRQRRPWLYSGAIEEIPRNIPAGATVEVVNHEGVFMARGACSQKSQITVRVWTWDQQEMIDAAFFRSRLEIAIRKRSPILADGATTACRLVNAESDGLPGVIVDRYGDWVVLQCLTVGAERWKQTIAEQLVALTGCRGVYDRSDAETRIKEGLKSATGVVVGEQPPELVEIRENGLTFLVDVIHGHKTGFYLDQRDNRNQVQAFAQGANVLNCFSYTGGFCVYALRGGAAHVTNVDASLSALELADKNTQANQCDDARVTHIQGDVFEVLRAFVEEQRTFDLVVLDPPKFADSRGQLPHALRGYKDINRLAFLLLRKGGVLFTFSCSGLLDSALFQKVVADAALDAGRSAQIVRRLTQAEDHPVALSFPEGSYLKGLVCRVD